MGGLDVIGFLKEIGFPIFVAVYLLIRVERTLAGLRDTLSGLRTTLTVLNAPWNGMERRREGGREPWQRPPGSGKG